MSIEARPIRSVSQVAAGARLPDRVAAEKLLFLERYGFIEKARGGYRATWDAWMKYPRPASWEAKKAA